MRRIASKLVPTTSAYVAFIAPTSQMQMKVTSISLCNTSTQMLNARLFHVGVGESASTSNALLYDYSIHPGDSLLLQLPVFIGQGEAIHVQSSVASALCVIAYGEQA